MSISLVINTLQYDTMYIQSHINTFQYDARYTQRHINTLQYEAQYTQRQINRAITYWKSVHNRLGTSEGSILSVHRSEGFGILI